MKKRILSFAILLVEIAAMAQPYSGSRRFDGAHRDVVEGYLTGGSNVVTGGFISEAVTYTRHLTDRWSVGAGEQIQFFKQVYSADVTGTYRLPAGKTNLYFDGRLLFNRYNHWRVNEPILHLSALWETSYVDLRLGGSYIHYWMVGVDTGNTDASYTEPIAVTVGLGVNIRPRSNPWNLGFFIRNYDHFYYENWNINWGFRFHATLTPEMKLFGEFNVRPAGSMSQLATRYETALKLGLRYVL